MHNTCVRTGLRAPAAAAASTRRARALVPRAATARVSFTLPLHVEFGTEVALVGSSPVLGEWDATSAVALSWTEGDVWTAEAEVPTGAAVEYKYIIRVPDDKKVIEWQPTQANLVLDIPEGAADEGPVLVRDDWTGGAHEVVIGAAAAAAIGAAAERAVGGGAAPAPAARAEEAPALVAEAASGPVGAAAEGERGPTPKPAAAAAGADEASVVPEAPAAAAAAPRARTAPEPIAEAPAAAPAAAATATTAAAAPAPAAPAPKPKGRKRGFSNN